MELLAKPELGTLQSSLRLRRLQAALPPDVDALLLVAGIDGRYNLGSSQAIAHLLLGASNNDVADACHLDLGLAESVLVIKRDSLLAYVPDSDSASKIREMLSECCPEIQILMPTPMEASDPDALEEHKMACMVQMLRGVKALAVPYACPARTGGGSAIPADPMQLEQWPLLQAFGLEDVGRGGFFTQNFKVRIELSSSAAQAL